MKGLRKRWVVVLLVVCLAVGLGFVVGRSSHGAHLPHVTTSVRLASGRHLVRISVHASGSGYGICQVGLTYPDGHRLARGGGLLADTTTLGYSYGPLPPGAYRYVVYAVARRTMPKYPIYPSGARTKRNIVAAGSFGIP